jgi:hypothetical protein
MSWTRGLIAALAVCVLLLTGSASCGSGDAPKREENASPSPVGKVLDDTDHEGRPLREVKEKDAPDIGIEVQPGADDSWNVRLTVRNFRFTPAGARAEAVPGRGVARLFVDDRPVTGLRTSEYRLSGRYVPHGTHQVTVRLYADDGTVWAVDGEPVESTADITASEPEPPRTVNPPTSASGTRPSTEGQASPGPGGEAS